MSVAAGIQAVTEQQRGFARDVDHALCPDPAVRGQRGVHQEHNRQIARLLAGFVSRASPVQTAARNCTRDEGGPFGFGDQVADPKPPQAAVDKSHGGERCGNVGTTIPVGKVERGECKRTVDEVSKSD
jgi:hypothetical protein